MRKQHLLALLLPAVFATGCYVEYYDEPAPSRARTGDLTLRYTFSSSECLAVGVHRIAVRLDGVFTNEVLRESLDCAGYAAGVTFEGLREDTYRVAIEARDANGGLLFALEDGVEVDVVWGTHQEYELDVPSTGGALTVFWTFDGSGFCGAVDEVRVRLADNDGFVFDDARYDCAYGGIIYDVLAHGVWSVSLDGLDGMGRVIYRAPERNVVVIRGAQNDYTIDLGANL